MKSAKSRTNLLLKGTPGKGPIRSNSGSNINKDPVNVYCRIRPMQSESDLSCLKVISPTTVSLTPPEIAINYKITQHKECQYIFKNVFDTKSRQREVFNSVAQPLVESLIRGRDGLLFTYGVTGSGKTYTMTGNSQQQGIMPRCMDVLFKTISDYQTKKYVFKPDRLNGFEIQSEPDAMLDRQVELNGKLMKMRKKESDSDIASQASADCSVVGGIDEDNMYAVFVTYVEVYNNSVFDLLESGPVQKVLQSKIIREDATHSMFVHGVTELEIKSVEEAIDIFQIGQSRKRKAHTILNAESSRSHAVFSIRLVQAPTDRQGEYVLQDKRTITVSQLSLVDLAGSERTNRTKNTGQRLREAGNINNSLMTLRNCLEILRENQLSGSCKKVPYRDSKITHLFKNYFEGEGQVRMIVCVNPRAEDFDETSQVMKFAEITQEVQVARATPIKLDVGLTPGRRKANNLFKIALNNMEEQGADIRHIEVDIGLVYSLGPNFPNIKLNSPEAGHLIQSLILHLEQRIQKRKLLIHDLNNRQDRFRMQLIELERENMIFKTENSSLKAILNQERQKISAMENKIVIHENSIDELNRRLREKDEAMREYQRLLNEKQTLLSQTENEKEKQKKILTSKMALQADKMTRELDVKLKEQRDKMREKNKLAEGKLKMVNQIIRSENIPSMYRSSSTESIPNRVVSEKRSNENQIISTHTPRSTSKGIAVANVRNRRSRSTGEKWLEHRAPNPVQLGTILQPYFKNRKSITKLTDVNDLVNTKISNYCLIDQNADTDGEVETNIYKGNIIPTTGGGAQVVFDDIECLKQLSPIASPQRKRSSNYAEAPVRDIASKCSIGIEGHSSKKPRI